jgi:hypothetical protein
MALNHVKGREAIMNVNALGTSVGTMGTWSLLVDKLGHPRRHSGPRKHTLVEEKKSFSDKLSSTRTLVPLTILPWT